MQALTPERLEEIRTYDEFQLRQSSAVVRELLAEVDMLTRELDTTKRALAGVIPWAGHPPEGPSWATTAAKARNREMYEQALSEACACFPPNFNGMFQNEQPNHR